MAAGDWQAAQHRSKVSEIPVSDDDRAFGELAQRFGLISGDQDTTAGRDADDRPFVPALPEGFALAYRTQRRDAPHPLRHRNGESVAQRLEQCPLFDPTLDLAVETVDGRIAGYARYWFDPVTEVDSLNPSGSRMTFSGEVSHERCRALGSSASPLSVPGG